jgi:hypothetical protein
MSQMNVGMRGVFELRFTVDMLYLHPATGLAPTEVAR